MLDKSKRPIWYQLLNDNELETKKETTKAFEAFTVYLNLRNDRSIPKASEMLSKSPGTLKRWARAYKWQERAESFDQWKYKQELENHEKRLKVESEKFSNDWMTKRLEIRKIEYQIGMNLLFLVNKFLNHFAAKPSDSIFVKKTVANKFSANQGNKEQIGIMETMTFESGINDIVKICQVADFTFKFLHNSANLPIENVRCSSNNLSVSTEEIKNFSDDERKKILKELKKEEIELFTILKGRGEI